MKLSHAIRGYFLDRSLELAETTIVGYRHYFTLFVEFVGDKEIEAITRFDVIEFLNHLQATHSIGDHTLYDVRARLSTLWTWAAVELDIPNIVARVAKPTYKEPEIIPYSQDEIRRLLKAAEYNAEWTARNGRKVRSKRSTATRDRAIIFTLLDTGLRASELCALTVGDYDEKRGRLHVLHGKGDKGRFVVTGKRTQKAIWRYMAQRPEAKDKEPLFDTGSGQHMTRVNLYHMIVGCGQRSNVKKAGVHRFRHTFAIEFLRNGGNVFQLQELLGHEDVRTVLTYVKVAERDIDSAGRHSPADNWKV